MIREPLFALLIAATAYGQNVSHASDKRPAEELEVLTREGVRAEFRNYPQRAVLHLNRSCLTFKADANFLENLNTLLDPNGEHNELIRRAERDAPSRPRTCPNFTTQASTTAANPKAYDQKAHKTVAILKPGPGWATVKDSPPRIRSVAVDRKTGDWFVGVEEGGLHRWEVSKAEWSDQVPFFKGRTVTTVAIDRGYVVVGLDTVDLNPLWKLSSLPKAVWENIEFPPLPVESISLVDSGVGSEVVAATSKGVWLSGVDSPAALRVAFSDRPISIVQHYPPWILAVPRERGAATSAVYRRQTQFITYKEATVPQKQWYPTETGWPQSSSAISALAVSSDGTRMYAATADGSILVLGKNDIPQWDLLQLQYGALGKPRIEALAVDSKNLYIGTKAKGVYRCSISTLHCVPILGLPDLDLRTIAISEHDHLLIVGTYTGIYTTPLQ